MIRAMALAAFFTVSLTAFAQDKKGLSSSAGTPVDPPNCTFSRGAGMSRIGSNRTW